MSRIDWASLHISYFFLFRLEGWHFVGWDATRKIIAPPLDPIWRVAQCVHYIFKNDYYISPQRKYSYVMVNYPPTYTFRKPGYSITLLNERYAWITSTRLIFCQLLHVHVDMYMFVIFPTLLNSRGTYIHHTCMHIWSMKLSTYGHVCYYSNWRNVRRYV